MSASKATIAQRITRCADDLVALSHRIHATPELGFEEHRASAWVAELLDGAGFAVTHGAYGLPTAVAARVGSGPVHVIVCAEYDALPGIGHACGHNVIAAAAAGAGVGLAGLVDDLGLTVTVLGTPAEENGGGKILMLERGAFDGADAAMMVHPAPAEADRLECLAVCQLDVRYHGKSAHAAAYPELGVNAADALTVAQVGIGLLRQHVLATDRIHGIVTEGGEAANIVPDQAAGRWLVRATTRERLADLKERVRGCFEAGERATGATLEIAQPIPDYSHFEPATDLIPWYRSNAEALGRRFPAPDAPRRASGSTDMANVSLAVPAIHPMLGLDCYPAVNHQAEFAAVCATGVADRAVLDGATALAWTAADVAASA